LKVAAADKTSVIVQEYRSEPSLKRDEFFSVRKSLSQRDPRQGPDLSPIGERKRRCS